MVGCKQDHVDAILLVVLCRGDDDVRGARGGLEEVTVGSGALSLLIRNYHSASFSTFLSSSSLGENYYSSSRRRRLLSVGGGRASQPRELLIHIITLGSMLPATGAESLPFAHRLDGESPSTDHHRLPPNTHPPTS